MEGFSTFVAGVALGGLLSWLTTHRYYIKSGRDQKREFDGLTGQLRSRNTLANFESILEASDWNEHYINETEIWIAEQDSTFQIERGERSGEFSERWTKTFPDQNGSAYPVYLKISGTVIHQLRFISLDGGRVFVPMPELRPVSNGEVEHFWNFGSLEVKVARVIGSYYIHKTLEGVAKAARVALVK